jgi:hypothetical protein
VKIVKRYVLYIIIIAFLILINIRIEHIEDESVELWDVYIGRYTITYTYDAIEGPVFWLSDDGLTLKRWPECKPRPRLTPNWA